MKKFEKAVAKLQVLYPQFYFKQRVTEEFVHLADEHYARLCTLQEEMKKREKQRGPNLHAKRLREIGSHALAFDRGIYRALPGIARLAA